MISESTQQSQNPWPRRLAVVLACAVFAVIWVGGLVTTYDAGKSIPDWPNTYGHLLVLYPWQAWIAGPWDVFIVHGHRMLGLLVTVLTVSVVVAVVRWDQRPRMRYFSLAVLGGVIIAGLLGGTRLFFDARVLGMVHACISPAILAACVAACAFSSRWWKDCADIRCADSPKKLHVLPTVTSIVIYTQVLIGVFLRHVPLGASPYLFRICVFSHLFTAATVVGFILLVAWRVWRVPASHKLLRVPASVLCVLAVCQLALGCATWVVNHYWPSWAADFAITTKYDTIAAQGRLQMFTTTTHVANGSLILATAVLLALRSFRLVRVK